MGADAAWKLTGFVLRVSSRFYLACVENDGRIVCWKLRWFPAVELTKIMRGENMISLFSTQHRVEIWFQLECAPEQLVSVVTANRHFLLPRFCCDIRT